MPRGRINLHAYQSHFTHDRRVLKETQSLATEGFFDGICIAAIWKPGLDVEEKLDEQRSVWRAPLWSRRLPDSALGRLVKYAEWQLRMFSRYRKQDIAVFNAHSLIVLPLGAFLKKLKRCKLIYDTHELATETQMRSRTQRRVFKAVESRWIHSADVVITVNDSIAAWYRETYGLSNVFVIKNVPVKPAGGVPRSQILRDTFGIGAGDLVFIHQGILEEGRGIGLILDVFMEAQRDKHVVFIGSGALEEQIKRCSAARPNIHFQPAVDPDEVLLYCASADVGIHVIENTCLNHYLCLPNKLFDYLASGLPAIVSDFPEMAKIVREEGCGWATPVEKAALLDLVNSVSWREVAAKKAAVESCAEKFAWHHEEGLLREIYTHLLSSESSTPSDRVESHHANSV